MALEEGSEPAAVVGAAGRNRESLVGR